MPKFACLSIAVKLVVDNSKSNPVFVLLSTPICAEKNAPDNDHEHEENEGESPMVGVENLPNKRDNAKSRRDPKPSDNMLHESKVKSNLFPKILLDLIHGYIQRVQDEFAEIKVAMVPNELKR